MKYHLLARFPGCRKWEVLSIHDTEPMAMRAMMRALDEPHTPGTQFQVKEL